MKSTETKRSAAEAAEEAESVTESEESAEVSVAEAAAELLADTDSLRNTISSQPIISKAEARDHLIRVVDLVRRTVELIQAK